MDEFIKFGRFVLGVGATKETYDLLVSWLGELTLSKDFLEFLNFSKLIALVLEFYNSFDEIIEDCGRRMINHLINSSSRISKESIPLFPLFLDLSSSLKKNDPLYSPLRNSLCQKVYLCEDGIKEVTLKVYVNEILGEAFDGISRYVESDVMINDGSYLIGVGMLPSLMHHFSKELKSDVLIGCELLLSLLDPLVVKDVRGINEKSIFLSFLHHLNAFISLPRVIGREDCMSSVIENRSNNVLKIAMKAVELDMFRLIESYLRYGNLMERFLEQLVMEFNSILGRRVTGEILILYDRMLLLIKRISKNVPRGEEETRTFLATKRDEICIMSTLFEVSTNNFCSDENLLTLERSICKADPEFRMELLLTVIPQIDSNSSWILEITRDNLTDDSLKSVLAANSSQLRGTLLVKFAGEDGRGPGVLREWLLLQCQEMLAMGEYFETVREDRRILLPTRKNVKNVDFFIFFGRLLALSFMHRVQGGFTLEPIVVKMLADIEVTLTDIMELDTGVHKNLTILMNAETHNEYVPLADNQLVADFVGDYFNDLIAEKIAHTKKGIDDIFGSARRRTLFSILHTCDLQMVISGEPDDILIEDWKLHTDYDNCERTDLHVCWFWKIVGKFSAEQKRDLLCFWTSVKYLPPGGFRNLGFRPLLHTFLTDDQDAAVTAATCGNQLNIPIYESCDILEERLYNILPFCVGFGFR